MYRNVSVTPYLLNWDEECTHVNFTPCDPLTGEAPRYITESGYIPLPKVHIEVEVPEGEALKEASFQARVAAAEYKITKRFAELEEAKEELSKLQCITQQERDF